MALNDGGAATPGMGDLHEKISEGNYQIEIKETRHGSIVALNKGGERTLSPEEHAELTSLLDEYKEIILELWDADSQDDDPHMSRWRMGRVLQEEVEEDDRREMEMLIPLLPFTDSEEYRNRHYIQKFYKIFPDKGWNEKDSVGIISELASRADSPEEARKIYDERIRDAEEKITRNEIRVWSDIQEQEGDIDLQLIVEKAIDRFAPQQEPEAKNIKIVYRLLGRVDFPSDEEIELAIQEIR